MIRVALFGALGKMGREIAGVAAQSEEIEIVKVIDKNADYIGQNYSAVTGIGGYDMALSDDTGNGLFADIECAVEFSEHAATAKHVGAAGAYGIPYVIGTTGFSDEELNVIYKTADNMPVFISSNMSKGINVINILLEQMVKNFRGYDIEIWEMHHRDKRDAPSGTAMMLAETIRNVSMEEMNIVLGRKGVDSKRKYNEISVNSIRGGDIFGEHHIMFAGIGENIEIVHRATNRKVFALGALEAVKFIVDKHNGLYTFKDILKV